MAYIAPFIGPQGLVVPAYQDILAAMIAEFRAIYGSQVYLGPDSADYQWISAVSEKLNDTYAALQLIYNGRGPLTAVGADLDGIVKLNGIQRKAASSSTCGVVITGASGTIINNGVVQDVNGFQWSLPPQVIIPSAGNITVTATCQTPGNVTANIGDLHIIATPTAGWTSVSNPAIPIPGQSVESDSQLRARQSLSVALPSLTMLAGTIAGIAATSGVTRYNVLENPTGSTDGFGNPPHSITAVVEGGTDLDVATAIYNNRGIGCFTNGTTSVTVTDSNSGTQMSISFDRPTYLPIYVKYTVHGLTGFTSSTLSAIQSSVVSYLNSLQIGESVLFSEMYGAALEARSNPELPSFSIKSVLLGSAAAQTTGTLTSGSATVTVASATGIANGQTAVGAGVPDGTTVSGISGTTVTLSANATASGTNVPLTFFTTGTSDVSLTFNQVANSANEYVVVGTI